MLTLIVLSIFNLSVVFGISTSTMGSTMRYSFSLGNTLQKNYVSPSVENKFSRSASIMQEAKTLMPGGVSSPVRAFKSVGGDPIVFDRVKGANIYDVDGNKFIDFVNGWGTGIVGHANPEVLSSISQTILKGTNFGAPCALENKLAKEIIAAIPSIEMVRFTSSGTEACMSALRLARAYTGKTKIIKFDGCYHGHADNFLVKAGSGVATLGYPDSPGVPKTATQDTLIAPYNDIEGVKALFKQYPNQIAAVIIEPVVGNAGFITPQHDFLKKLRKLTKEQNSLLIFDEVMSGFRVAYGGAQEHYHIVPDLTTLGKIIGGGMPVGAYGGRKDIMSMVAPAGPVYQAGTLSGNPVSMASGLKTVQLLKASVSRFNSRNTTKKIDPYVYLSFLSNRLINGLKAKFKEHYRGDPRMKLQGNVLNGMFGYFFNANEVTNYEDAKQSDAGLFKKFHREMLLRGVYLPPSPYEACFMSLAHTTQDIDNTINIAAEVFKIL